MGILLKQMIKLVVIMVLFFLVACSDSNDANGTNDENEMKNETNDEQNLNDESNSNDDENNINDDRDNDSNAMADADFEALDPEDVADAFLNGEYERVHNQASEEFQGEVTANQFKEIGEDFNEGVEGYVFQSEMPIDGMVQYTWADESETKGIVAVFGENDTIEGFRVLPLKAYPETDDQFTETEFQLPFEDEWYVFWGGTNELINYHYAVEEQRYAFDFLMREDDSSYDGDSDENESYYAFGEDMLAPADGVVVEVENDIPDNEPVGEMNAEEPLGNYVIIDHGNDEYSFLAHMKQGSVRVGEGDEVQVHDVLGLVGNSGNSS